MDGAASVSRAVLLVERRRVAISRRHRGVPFDVLIAISSGRRPESIAAKIAEGTPLCRPLWRWRRIERAHALLTNPSYTLSEPCAVDSRCSQELGRMSFNRLETCAARAAHGSMVRPRAARSIRSLFELLGGGGEDFQVAPSRAWPGAPRWRTPSLTLRHAP